MAKLINIFSTVKAKVISVGTLLAAILAITAFFNIELPSNAYISDIEAAESRLEQKVYLSRADLLRLQYELYTNRITQLEEAISRNYINKIKYKETNPLLHQEYVLRGVLLDKKLKTYERKLIKTEDLLDAMGVVPK